MRHQVHTSFKSKQTILDRGLSKIYSNFSLDQNDPLSKRLVNSFILNINKVYKDIENNTTTENGVRCLLGVIKIISTICMSTDDEIIDEIDKYHFVLQTKDIFLNMVDRWVDNKQLTFINELEKKELFDFIIFGTKVFKTITKGQYAKVVKYIDDECKEKGIAIQYSYNV